MRAPDAGPVQNPPVDGREHPRIQVAGILVPAALKRKPHTNPMNQILAFIMLIAASLAIAVPLVFFGTERIGDAGLSYHDFAEQSRIRSGQAIAVTYLCSSAAGVNGTIVNIGLHDITVFAALADGDVLCSRAAAACPNGDFGLARYGDAVGRDGSPLVPEGLANFTAKGATAAVQIVTDSGRLFEIPVPDATAPCGP